VTRASLAGAAGVALAAFLIFRTTMLPGVELGDSASFQVMTGQPLITPRDAYPLYFGIARLFYWTLGGSPAHVLNLVSVVEGAVACGLIVLVAAELSSSIAAGIAAALLFAGSYTFWSQSIIAEVYALHILLVALTLLLLLRWSKKPSLARLAWFFAAYAVSFGNHLSMILLAPAYTLFLLVAVPRGWRSILTPRVIALAIVMALAGASQYLWNLHALWLNPTAPPHDLADGLRKFWFDVTKADWRNTMILGVPREMLGERLQMYLFDLRQQFGAPGIVLAIVGTVALARRSVSRAALLMIAYAATVTFALAYNVGDSHVFFLPSHLMVALLAAPAIAWVGELLNSQSAIVAVMIIVASTRIYRDYPALDRRHDQRPYETLNQLTDGLDDQREILLTTLNWQVENGLTYFAKRDRTSIAHALFSDVQGHAPTLIGDNHAVGRSVVLTERARGELDASSGARFVAVDDSRVETPTVDRLVRALPSATRYVLCVLAPTTEFSIDAPALAGIVQHLTGGHRLGPGTGAFFAMAGVVGAEPVLYDTADTPFRDVITISDLRVDVRMESWLTFDTIRRMGFGHVVAAHRHTLIVERGVSFVALDATGSVISAGYDANIFAPQPRYIVR
jgi:hypothetical protein